MTHGLALGRNMKKILVLNGPNLNLLGTRQPELYGHATLADVERDASTLGAELGFDVTCKQSNYEGQLIDWIQDARADMAGIFASSASRTTSLMAA